MSDTDARRLLLVLKGKRYVSRVTTALNSEIFENGWLWCSVLPRIGLRPAFSALLKEVLLPIGARLEMCDTKVKQKKALAFCQRPWPGISMFAVSPKAIWKWWRSRHCHQGSGNRDRRLGRLNLGRPSFLHSSVSPDRWQATLWQNHGLRYNSIVPQELIRPMYLWLRNVLVYKPQCTILFCL